jgi:D-alanyl-D-alanine carboxypeptidase/D-alanyl-D-alanine-endopeptidase (penicillin-binding protein 4)
VGGHRRAAAGRVWFGVLLTVVLCLAVGAGAFFGTRAGLGPRTVAARPTPTVTPTPTPTPSALASATLSPPSAAPVALTPLAAAAVAAELAAPLRSRALGSSVLAEVRDADTGQVLFARGSSIAAAPASTAKLATAVAVLTVHAAADRITTSVVAGSVPGEIVLVGGGDPTLSAAAPGVAPPYDDAARISTLAAALRTSGRPVTKVVVDDSRFTGPSVSPSWQREDVPTSYESAVTALMADGGRATPGAIVRSSTPDIAAGDALAADLGLTPAAVSRGTALAGATVLTSVQSATYGELVEQMLQQSDNVIAECLARQVAIAEHQPASFLGAAAAVRSVLAGLGVAIGAGMTDGSGLAPGDRLSPAVLTAILRLALSDARPGLSAVITDLPVAGWDGTLATRYVSGPARVGAGLVRAKTGTLTSVSTLAGIVTTTSGHVLVFSFVANAVGVTAADTTAAEAALDVLASALVAS